MKFDTLFKTYKCYLKSNQLGKSSSRRNVAVDDQSTWSDKFASDQIAMLAKKSVPLNKESGSTNQVVHRSADFGNNKHPVYPSTIYSKSPFSKIDPAIDISMNSLEVESQHKLQITKDFGFKDYTFDLDGPSPMNPHDGYHPNKEINLAKEDIGHILHKYHNIKKMNNEVKKIIKDNEELEACTFRPKINPESERLMSADKYRPVVA